MPNGINAIARVLELEAELALLADLRDTATDNEEFQRLDAAWRSLHTERHDLLASLTAEDAVRLEQARAEKRGVARA